MNTQFLLDPARGELYRRALLVGVLLTGVIAGLIVLSSQEAADFLREGPARLTGLEGSTLRLVLGVGTLVATVLAVVALWPRAGIGNVVAGAAAIGVGLFLIHGLMMPAAGLFAAAVGTEVATRIPRERLRHVGPRSYPVVWAIGAVGAVAGIIGLVWLTVWLVQPFFDEGDTLNEDLGFTIAGVDDEEEDGSAAPAEAATTEAATTDDTADAEESTATQSTAAADDTASDDGDEAPAEQAGDAEDDAETSTATQSAAAAEEDDDGDDEAADATSDEPTEQSAAADEAAATEPEADEPAAEEPEAEEPPAENQGRLVSRGELMGADEFHTGSGDVLLVIGPDGEVILRFQDYTVRNGPDLHVYLTPDPGGDVHVEGAISLGPVKATQGSVNYEVPADVDLDSFRAAVIYCVPFQVTFATAVLDGA